MKNKQIKKSKIISLSIRIFAVLFVFAGITYAFWTLSKEQTNPNVVISKCLDLELTNETGTFGLVSAWPITDSEGLSLPGYTFDVVNNCKEDITYIIGMDSLAVDGNLEYLQNSTIKISLDDTLVTLFSELESTDHVTNKEYTIRESKEIHTAIVKGKSSNTHNVKAWIKIDAPIEENNKVFSGRVFITGGQFMNNDKSTSNTTAESCFEIDNTGEIIGYNKKCGTSVIIPAKINNIEVKSISSDAFKSTETIFNYDFKVVMNSDYNPVYGIILNKNREQEIIDLVIREGFGSLPRYYYDQEGLPSLKNGEQYFYYTVEGGLRNYVTAYSSSFSNESIETVELAISELDLSKADYLETIKAGAFNMAELQTIYSNNCSWKEPAGSIDTVSVPKGLTKLTFGNQPNLKIGMFAFAGLDVDELTIYSTIKGYSDCYLSSNLSLTHNDSDIAISSSFAYSNIGTLNILPNESNTVLKHNTLVSPFYNSSINEINIHEGITEINNLGNINNVRTINLPDTLEIIRDYTFMNTIAPTITIPNSITRIERDGFYSWPNTSTINIKLTQAEAASRHLEEGWNGYAIINYKN